MTRPQRRPANLRAFPELGLVMRWPGFWLASLGAFGFAELVRGMTA